MNRIKELRKQKKLTQKELAKYLQIADSTLSYWELGTYEPDQESLKKLSKFFLVPIDYILYNDMFESYIPNNFGSVQASYNRGEFLGLSQDEIEKLAEYAEFLQAQRAKKK